MTASAKTTIPVSSYRHFEQTGPFVIQVVVNAIEALHEALCLR